MRTVRAIHGRLLWFVLVLCLGAAVALVGASGASAARLTVCASGCTYTTIPAALAAARDGDTIAVGAGSYSGELTIGVSVRLIGAGEGATTITGRGVNPNDPGPAVLTIAAGKRVTISRMTITGGFSEFSGGGIDNWGNLTLVRTTVDRNVAVEGAGVHNHVGGTITIFKSRISHNDATSVGGAMSGFGGGIYNEGTVTASKSRVVDNTSSGDDAAGGGIFNLTGAVTLSESSLHGNTASAGIDVASGGGAANRATMVLWKTWVTQNTASCGGCIADGGGFDNSGTLVLNRSPVVENSALGDIALGGGIANAGSLTRFRSPVVRNLPDDCVGC